MKKPKVEDVLDRNTDRLMALAGVEGVGIGGTAEAPVILVMVRRSSPSLEKKIPKEIDGYPVRIEATGEIRAY